MSHRFLSLALILVFSVHGRAQTSKHDSPFDLGIALSGLTGKAAGLDGNAWGAIRGSLYFDGKERWMALDAEAGQMLANSSATPYRGGRAIVGLFGIKMKAPSEGPLTEDERTNLYMKFRPGFIRWSSAVTGLGAAPAGSPQPFVPLRRGPLTSYAFDLGVVVERQFTNGWGTRVDIGDLVVWYDGHQIASGPYFKGSTQSNFQFSTGVFYTF